MDLLTYSVPGMHCGHCERAVKEEIGTVAGVLVRNGDHWSLDVDTGTAWHPDTPLPNPRNHLGVIALDGRIYAIGGQHQGNELDGNQSTVERYDTSTKQWTTVTPLPVPKWR